MSTDARLSADPESADSAARAAIQGLRAVPLFDGLSDEQLAELATAGELTPMSRGDELFREGKPADQWWVLVDGEVEMTRHIGQEDLMLATMSSPGQWAGGLRAWDETAVYMATGRCSVSGRMLQVPATALHEVATTWFPFGVHIITGLMQTVRRIESMARQREKLIALGTLSAGLAHELNNPAAAAARAVDALSEATSMLVGAVGPLGASSLSAAQCAGLESFRQEAMSVAQDGTDAAPGASLRESDREDAITDWLDDHGVERSWMIAPALAAAGLDVGFCGRVLALLGPALGPGLELIAGSVSTGALLAEVKDATSRISGLVAAVKSYSQMDRASVQLINVADGLESTVVMLAHKLRGGVVVERDWPADLPTVKAIPGELNQVWTNLIDNAVDAMGGSGVLRLAARVAGDRLLVEVIDDGPGMPAEVRARAFDPFFTTKDVGKGTGLGLDISRRIVVEHHSGDISIDSRPGRTAIQVSLPLPHPR